MKEIEIGLRRGYVALVKYQEEWARSFKKEKKALKKAAGDTAADIQHVGSTAVPGLSSKPIIDIAMAVNKLSEVSKIRDRLEGVGYVYGEKGTDNTKIFFSKGPVEKRTHYLHITEINSTVWEGYILFRDYLLDHPESVDEYEKLKQKLAKKYPKDRGAYTDGKEKFVKAIIEKAKKNNA